MLLIKVLKLNWLSLENNSMKSIALSFLVLSILGFSCKSSKSPDEVFSVAKEKILETNQLSFNQLMLWEDPNLGEIDTFSMEIVLRKNTKAAFGFDFLGKSEDSNFNFIEGVLSSVSHEDSTITFFQEEEVGSMIQNTMYLSNSPLKMFRNGPWRYLGDTAIGGKSYHDFLWVEIDSVIMDKNVYLENHLFINPSNENVDFFSRRLFHDGKKSQFIEVQFRDYQFGEVGENLAYQVPEGYLSKEWGQEKTAATQLLQKGDLAPDFELIDEKGNIVKLSELKGKKVLLDFSMINCGWCKIAIDQFNKPDFQFADNIVPFYINPVDSKEKMDKYQSKVSIPFPVLIDAKEVGKDYGVNGYPTFVLINENGKVDEVVVGFSDEAILKWKKGGV